MKNALFTKEGKWFLIPELPESPVYPGHEVQRLYDKALAEAIANALPVANPEIIPKGINMDLDTVKDVLWGGVNIHWPGLFEVKSILSEGWIPSSIDPDDRGLQTSNKAVAFAHLILPTAERYDMKTENLMKEHFEEREEKLPADPYLAALQLDNETRALRDQLREKDELIKELLRVKDALKQSQQALMLAKSILQNKYQYGSTMYFDEVIELSKSILDKP